VRERVPNDWWLLHIVCDAAGRGQEDLANAQVRITVYPGDHVTCTFVNGASSAILSRVYFDHNLDGKLNRLEVGVPGWRVTVYNATGQQVRSDRANLIGKANFWELPPGTYKVCAENRAAWWNTQPGEFDPSLSNQPCYTVNAAPGNVHEAFFGFAVKLPPSLRKAAAVDGLRTMPNPYLDNSEEGSDQPFVDPDAESPFAIVMDLFLPMIKQ
jgi:hypothetical protein